MSGSMGWDGREGVIGIFVKTGLRFSLFFSLILNPLSLHGSFLHEILLKPPH